MVDGRWAVRLRLLAMMLLLGAPAVWGQDFRGTRSTMMPPRHEWWHRDPMQQALRSGGSRARRRGFSPRHVGDSAPAPAGQLAGRVGGTRIGRGAATVPISTNGACALCVLQSDKC